MNYINQFFNSAIGHWVKIFIYVAVSGALTALLTYVTNSQQALGPIGFLLITGAINGALGSIQKLRDPSVPNLPTFSK